MSYKTIEFFNQESPSYRTSLTHSSIPNDDNPLNITWTKNRESKIETTKNPKVFGPPLWFSIHNSAVHYPINPLPEVKQGIKDFIRSIPYLVPCDECYKHARAYIYKFTDAEIDYIVRTRQSYFKFTVDFHNFVNRRLGKPVYSYKDAYDLYHNPSHISVMKYG